ncbi:MAG: energy-coupling factor transporter ATPase [Bacilli bacterium]|nr:energy-coupling factor transporter ATPase [Bacilli bacterium]
MGINFYDVDFTYDVKASKTLKNINLKINKENEFITILGHTGSGKSTLVQLMNALNLPNKGVVEVAGIKILPNNKEMLKPVRRHVGLVFQFPEYQLFEETVLKDVMFGPKNFDKNNADVELSAKQALKMVSLDESLYERSPFNLSGGQMRRVAIAGILASNPDILVLDEPTVGLDPKGKTDLMEMLVEIQKETNKSVIIITHDMNVVAKYSKRCIVLDDGKIVYDGGKREMFENSELLKNHNLDLPDISKVANSLKNKGLITFEALPLTKDELFNVITRGDENE